MPEEELDDLFRKAASEFQPEFDPAAWQAMEKKLDASHPPPPGFWPRIGWLAALLLTMGLGFFVSLRWLENKEESKDLASSQSVRPAAPARPSQTDGKRAAPARTEMALGGQPSREAAAPAATQLQPEESQAQTQRPADKPAGRLPGKAFLTQPDRSTRYRRLYPPLAAADRGSRRQESRQRKVMPVVQPTLDKTWQEGAREQTASQPDNRAGAAAAREIKPDSALTRPPLALPGAASPAQPTADSLAKAVSVPADSSFTPDTKALAGWSRLALRLLIAPDLSTVGFARPEGISTNAGIVLSYQFTPRWSLAAGVLVARKVYGARAEDYAGYWYGRTPPYHIDALCRVLDVPLNVGYQLVSREKSAVVLSTGLSSYWMLSEDYEYDYRYPNGTSYTRSYGVRNQNRHLFSIYNLSGSYIHRLGPAMTWGVEPFIKVPLAGVGAGRVKLASGGIFFSLGYQFR